MNTPLLQLKNFSFAFAQTQVLQGVNFSLNLGDYLSIIGPNGAGKSTLLKCLLRLHEHGRQSGEILIQGQALTNYKQPELARVISYVPQAGGWVPPFSVEEFIRLSRYPHTKLGNKKLKAAEPNCLISQENQASPPAQFSSGQLSSGQFSPDNFLSNQPQNTHEQAVAKAIALTGLENLAQRSLRNLSGGERQKAYLAAALAQDTKIMLLDEPAAFLDPKHASDVYALLKNLNPEHGLTMLTVTHDLNHPLQAGGKVLVLKPGQQLYFGPTQVLLPILPNTSGILEQAFNHSFSYFNHPHKHCPTVLPAVLAD